MEKNSNLQTIINTFIHNKTDLLKSKYSIKLPISDFHLDLINLCNNTTYNEYLKTQNKLPPTDLPTKPPEIILTEPPEIILTEQLGSGGYNDVYKIDDKTVFRTTRISTEFKYVEDELYGLFIQHHLSECNNICKVYEFGVYQLNNNKYITTYAYSILELFDTDLFDYYANNKDITYNDANKIISDILTGLQCMHNKQFYHFDIKPENIGIQYSITKDGKKIEKAVLLDFSFSRYIENKTEVVDCGSKDVECKETPFYVDPILIKHKKYHIKSDMFSFGMVIFKIFNKLKKYTKLINDLVQPFNYKTVVKISMLDDENANIEKANANIEKENKTELLNIYETTNTGLFKSTQVNIIDIKLETFIKYANSRLSAQDVLTKYNKILTQSGGKKTRSKRKNNLRKKTKKRYYNKYKTV